MDYAIALMRLTKVSISEPSVITCVNELIEQVEILKREERANIDDLVTVLEKTTMLLKGENRLADYVECASKFLPKPMPKQILYAVFESSSGRIKFDIALRQQCKTSLQSLPLLHKMVCLSEIIYALQAQPPRISLRRPPQALSADASISFFGGRQRPNGEPSPASSQNLNQSNGIQQT